MMQCKMAALLVCKVAAILASSVPLAAIHVKYVAPAHQYFGSFYSAGPATLQGGNLVAAARSQQEAVWPAESWMSSARRRSQRPFLSPSDDDYASDPLLVRGDAAAALARSILCRGEMFYDSMPHARALLRVQEQRRRDGLPPLRMGSNRPDSPFFLWTKPADGSFFLR